MKKQNFTFPYSEGLRKKQGVMNCVSFLDLRENQSLNLSTQVPTLYRKKEIVYSKPNMSNQTWGPRFSVPPQQRLQGKKAINQCVYKLQLWDLLVGRLSNVWEIRHSMWSLHTLSLGVGESKCVKLVEQFQEFISKSLMLGEVNKWRVSGCWKRLRIAQDDLGS